jgi:DHA1 family multidrug resistance protein-like MFS transporter
LIYHVSGRRWFRYQEEIEGFIVPERYRLGAQVPHGNGLDTRTSTNTNTTAVGQGGAGLEGKEEGEMVVVDWYGDDDPENPQNWYVLIVFR